VLRPPGNHYSCLLLIRWDYLFERAVSLRPVEEKNFAVNIVSYKNSEASYDGLLGMDFLTKHKYQIDYEKQFLVWE
jgi:hypothetical protein